MNRRGFFRCAAAAIGASAAVVVGVRAASATPVFVGRIGTIDGMVIHQTRSPRIRSGGCRLVWSRDIWSKVRQ